MLLRSFIDSSILGTPFLEVYEDMNSKHLIGFIVAFVTVQPSSARGPSLKACIIATTGIAVGGCAGFAIASVAYKEKHNDLLEKMSALCPAENEIPELNEKSTHATIRGLQKLVPMGASADLELGQCTLIVEAVTAQPNDESLRVALRATHLPNAMPDQKFMFATKTGLGTPAEVHYNKERYPNSRPHLLMQNGQDKDYIEIKALFQDQYQSALEFIVAVAEAQRTSQLVGYQSFAFTNRANEFGIAVPIAKVTQTQAQ